MLTLIVVVFLLGYIFIALENEIQINKSAIALLTGISIWIIYTTSSAFLVSKLNLDSFNFFIDNQERLNLVTKEEKWTTYISHFQLPMQIGNIASTLFYLVGAMTIVETINLFGGFDILTRNIKADNKKRLLWLITGITFILSAVLDNLTTTIVMLMLVRKLVFNIRHRHLFACVVIFAANSGGTWSPIGDITTIMLWVSDTITSTKIILNLFIPSVVSCIVVTSFVSHLIKGDTAFKEVGETHSIVIDHDIKITARQRKAILIVGLSSLLFTPIFKAFTNLPPYMGILFSLAILWISIQAINHRINITNVQESYTVADVLKNIDIPTILFYLGILLAVAGLEVTGILNSIAITLNTKLHDIYLINGIIAIASSIIDNVPLVAAAIGMYPIATPDMITTAADPTYLMNFIKDGPFWLLTAYCSGVGGSSLIIGSAAGVITMGIENISFSWYLRHFSLYAIIGFLVGAGVFIGQYHLFH